MGEAKRKGNAPKIKKYAKISSTQEYAEKYRARGENLIVAAARQTAGKGTKGRSFSSEKGGVYLSALTFYEDLAAKDAFLIMAGTCVAVCKTLEEGGLTPKIKWPNDVFVNGKKICGILTENTLAEGKVESSLCGIGLNVENVLPDELDEIATSVLRETGKAQKVKKWRERLISRLDFPLNSDTYREYVARLGFVGETVTLVTQKGSCLARVLGADEAGRLRVRVGGEERVYSSAEVVRLSH